MISFTSNVKTEVASSDGTHDENIAMLSAIVRNSGKYDDEKIVVVTENSKVAKKVYLLLNDIYHVNVRIDDKDNTFNRNRLYLVIVSDNIDFILKDLSIIDEDNNYLERIDDYIIDSEDEVRAYLKGVFLSCGSVNDPKTSRYHLEFFIEKEKEAYFINELLNRYYLNSKVILKDKKYMVYVKEAEKIGDFLRIINAHQAVMYYEDIRIYRDHKNMTNRLNNMEQANIEKTINACNKDILDINYIIDKLGKEVFSEKEAEAVTYRLKYPESSLQELSEIMTLELGKSITKSGLNHRFRKIREISRKLKESEEE